MTREEAQAELAQTLQRLGPVLLDRDSEGLLVAEWVVIVGYLDEDDCKLEVVTSPAMLQSHTLGAVEFARLCLRDDITSDH